MPGSIASMAVQKKHRIIPPSQGPLSTHTIQSQRKGKPSERIGENVSHSKPESQTKRATCFVNKSAQIHNTLSPRPAAVNGQNVDERLKAARERREENQKLLASRELSRLEREQRARRYYEQQLQERKKRLLEQRLKEEKRRAAVEEKRKQRLREEKARYESAVRKTLEKSQKAQQTLNQITRGRKLIKNVPRRLPLTTWEKNLVSRLLTPTCSYLARSKSAACQSGQEVVHVCRRAVSFHSMNTTTTPTTSTTPKPQYHPGPGHHRSSPSPNANNNRPRSVTVPQSKVARQQETVNKNPPGKSASAKSITKPSTVRQKSPASPSPERTPRRSISRHSTPMQLELPSVPEEDASLCISALSSGNMRRVRKSNEGQRETPRRENPPGTLSSNLTDKDADIRRPAGDGSPSKTIAASVPQAPQVTNRTSAGTTDPNEALRLLAEKRREARLQREKEEQERLQREEAERRSREELERRRAEEQARQEAEERARQQAEERARQQAEARRLIEEKRRREEEEQRQAEEERAQAMREAALLQKKREEEQAREKAQAEQMQQQREIIAQKEEAERQARKKRLEEIMRRTRRTDSPDMKSVPVRILPNEAKPKENTEPVHNIKGEEIRVPMGTEPTPLGLSNDEDMVPVVAFKERRSLRTLTGLEEIQTHQRAEVI